MIENKKRLAAIALVAAILLYIPYTRAAILFVLPLGSGIDDLLFLIFLFGGVMLYLTHMATHNKSLQDSTRWLFFLILALALGAVIVSWLLSYAL